MRETQPLSGVRIVDLSSGSVDACSRYLADLGADVVLVEPPGGSAARHLPPFHEGQSLYAFVHFANKRSVVLDPALPGGRERLRDLLATADICIESGAQLERYGFVADELLSLFPHLVTLSASDFGRTGPYRGYRGNDWVHLAMAGIVSRSGVDGMPPLMPPAQIAGQATAIQAAWSVLLAYWNRLETGHGDFIDFSLLEATAQVLDPALGSVGTAAAAQGGRIVRGRPKIQSYPIFKCLNGHIRLVVLARRQWQGLRAWLGEPEQFSGPQFEDTGVRFAHADVLYPFMAEFFSGMTIEAAVAEGQRRGVPVAPVLTPQEVLKAPHYAERRALRSVRMSDDHEAVMPNGYLRLDGERAGFRSPAPGVGQHTEEALAERREPPPPAAIAPRPRRPLQGLRVLDLGVIVMGAEAGRLFADQGADVIKIESRNYPDGSRGAIRGKMTAAFASTHRNKQSLGLNLRHPDGVRLFKSLVAKSDVVLSNFKPGTLEALGLGPDVLRAVNPRVVVVSCSAMGADGPWSTWMGYGPLVRCVAGLTSLWRYPEVDGRFGDATTIYPDHLAARVVNVAALAALIGRRQTGTGAWVECAQAEVILNALATLLLQDSLAGGAAQAVGNIGLFDAPWGLFPCAGDDEWCVVTVADSEEFHRLAEAIGQPGWLTNPNFTNPEGRLAHREELSRTVEAWTRQRSPREVTSTLQEAGVAAGFMARTSEFGADPQFEARGFVRHVMVAGIEKPVHMENGAFHALRIPDPEIVGSPYRGQHTRQVCQRVLGLADAEVESLVKAGVLELADEIPAPA